MLTNNDIANAIAALVEEKFPGVRDAYISDWFHVTPPGGESPAQMADRVGRCVDQIIEKGGDTLIAAHNEIGRASL